jgi:hypothetical protein
MRPSFSLELDYPPLILRQLDALCAYAAEQGTRWKQDLKLEWASATAGPLLHHLRQTHGSFWLDRFQLPH